MPLPSWPCWASARCRSCGAARIGRTGRYCAMWRASPASRGAGRRCCPRPSSPRGYAQLAYHIFNIADAFLEHEVQGLPLKEGAYGRVPPPEMNTKAKILAYGQDVLGRFRAWWDGTGQTTDFSCKARVYYGNVTLLEYLERTTWHSGQHVRQLVMVLEMLGIEPDRPPTKETFAGLPMPDKVWDDERVIA